MDWLLLLLGVACAALGGELFVRGSVGLARWLRVAPGIVGATVAAFSTSSPEFSVSVSSAIAGTPQIALGDALGSNVVNVALVLGLALIVSAIHSPRSGTRRDFPIAMSVPALTGVLLIDGTLSRIDGLVMILCFGVWLTLTMAQARRERSAAGDILSADRHGRVIVWSILGFGLLVAAGTLIVAGAKGIAAAFGIPPFVIGATVVSVGTSVPELATTLIAKLRGHDEIGLGTILGSNIFNGLLIVGVAAAIRPIRVPIAEIAPALGFGVAALVLAFPTRAGIIPRSRGILLLFLYAGYVVTVIVGGGA